MAPIIHYTTFPISEAKTDRSLLQEAYQLLTKADGLISSFHGIQVAEEGSKNMYFVSIWESVKHHERFREIAMINQENDIAKRFIPLTQAMSAAGDKLIRYQLELVQGTAIPALESKNTEFVIITPKEGVSLERIREVGLDVHDVWDTNGHPIALWESVEGDRTFLIIVGWLSTTHHYDTVKNEPYASVVNAFSQVGNFNISHAHLEKNI